MKSIKLKYVTILLSLIAGAYAINVGAQQATAAPGPSQSATPEMVGAATPESVVAAATAASANTQVETDSFEAWIRSFEQKFQKVGVLRDGKKFYSGKAEVLEPTAKNIGQQIALAYEQAIMDMRAAYIFSQVGNLASEASRNIREDSGTDKDKFDPAKLPKTCINEAGDQLAGLLAKAAKVVDKKLDNELIEQGVPANQVARLTVEQKRVAYQDNLVKNMVKEGARSMSGLVPVQTRIFTKKNSNGTTLVVGVIAVQSPKTRQFAIDMARKVPTAVTGDPQKIEDLLPKNRADYLNDLGLRYSYDEAGRPMLLSYGRSSVTVESGWSAGRVERAIQNAKDAAATLAESTIIEFMNTNVEAKQELFVGKINEIIQSQTTTFTNCTDKVAQPKEDEIKKIINTLVTASTAKSSGSLQGTSVVDTWEMKDDLGTLQVGSVVTWTYSQLDDAKKIEAQSSGINTSRGEAGTINSTSRPSRIINKLNDF